jgi:hypothetical protein
VVWHPYEKRPPPSFPGPLDVAPLPHPWRPQPPAHVRGYDRAWAKLRGRYFAYEPECRACASRGVTRRSYRGSHRTRPRRTRTPPRPHESAIAVSIVP